MFVIQKIIEAVSAEEHAAAQKRLKTYQELQEKIAILSDMQSDKRQYYKQLKAVLNMTASTESEEGDIQSGSSNAADTKVKQISDKIDKSYASYFTVYQSALETYFMRKGNECIMWRSKK